MKEQRKEKRSGLRRSDKDICGVQVLYFASDKVAPMKVFTLIVTLTSLLAALALTVSAQCPTKSISYEEAQRDKRTCTEVCGGKSADKNRPAIWDCGLLNGLAINIPAPKFPKKYNVTDTSVIMVHIYLDEEGKVFFARACNNAHPELSRAAIKAAYKARFRITTCSGHPIKIDGLVEYNLRNSGDRITLRSSHWRMRH